MENQTTEELMNEYAMMSKALYDKLMELKGTYPYADFRPLEKETSAAICLGRLWVRIHQIRTGR